MKELHPALSEKLNKGEFIIAEERYEELREETEQQGLEGNRVRVRQIYRGNINEIADLFAANGVQARLEEGPEYVYYLVVGPEDYGKLEELLGD